MIPDSYDAKIAKYLQSLDIISRVIEQLRRGFGKIDGPLVICVVPSYNKWMSHIDDDSYFLGPYIIKKGPQNLGGAA